jgi:uncharacterized protein involved in exopolysaccharide biosynthesis
LVAIGVAGYVSRIPNKYSSDAVIMVRQPAVSSRYVETGITSSVADEVNGLKQEILSRSRVLDIVREFNLFEDEDERADPGLAVARLQSDIVVEPVDQTREGNFTTFRVAFEAKDPQLTRDVVRKVTSLFIESNIEQQGAQTDAGRTFLTEQLRQAKKRLDDQEAQLRAYKIGNFLSRPLQTPWS